MKIGAVEEMFVFRCFLTKPLNEYLFHSGGFHFFWFNYLTIKFHSAIVVGATPREPCHSTSRLYRQFTDGTTA